jgi:hypothetical protein
MLLPIAAANLAWLPLRLRCLVSPEQTSESINVIHVAEHPVTNKRRRRFSMNSYDTKLSKDNGVFQ